MAFAPAALAQTLAEAFAYKETQKIVEVRVHPRLKPGGRGWAVTRKEGGIEYCYIVTPFHVIGDVVTRTEYGDIVVEGAGYRLIQRAQHIDDDGRDLALLLLDREGVCPFTDGPSSGRAASGLWLVRLSDTKVREEIEGDARVPIAPASENLDIASMTVAAADRTNFTQGWSGATVFRDGRRIGMVVQAADEGATARFYTAQGIVRAFRDQITIYERHDGVEPVVEGASQQVLKVGETFVDCAACPEMVVVPVGSFMMGSPETEDGRAADEGPQQQVQIGAPFAVGRFEVTRDQFDAYVRATGDTGGSSCFLYENGEWGDSFGRSYRDPGFSQFGDHPVVCVSWDDAKAYADWLSDETGKQYRLLSEAEWEYVARAGSTSRFSFGDREYDICLHGNSADLSTDFVWRDLNCNDGYARTAPVGKFAENGFTVHDMHGNVSEWTEDCKKVSYSGAPDNGAAWTSGNCLFRVLRGGSWNHNARYLRSADRDASFTDTRFNYIGFRVARTLTP